MDTSELTSLAAFQDLPPAELDWLANNGYEVRLEVGDYFSRQNDPQTRFYVVIDGELQITRSFQGREIVLGTTPRGIMGGETALLNGEPTNVTSRAILPARLLVLDPPEFFLTFANCPVFGTRVFQVATQRTLGWASTLKQQEKMAALGKLSAGLAHELNNPAAAARRTARSLRESLTGLQHSTLQLHDLDLSRPVLEKMESLQSQALEQSALAPILPPLERSDREEKLIAWLEAPPPDGAGIAAAWELAPAFVSAGVTLEQLRDWAGELPAEALAPVLQWLNETLCAAEMMAEIEESTRRISDLVGAVKEYTYMDQAVFQEVDIHKGLDNTLTVLGYKLKKINVIREYDPNLPCVLARGSDLNQVWTNLIDNAIDALNEEGTIWLITRCENDYVMVEVADDGPGIPEEVKPHLFEPFFTTKEVGIGTGLGLDISYRIVSQHNGSIEAQSNPGRTRFIVRLPVNQPESNHDGG